MHSGGPHAFPKQNTIKKKIKIKKKSHEGRFFLFLFPFFVDQIACPHA